MDRQTKLDVLQKEIHTRDEILLLDVFVWIHRHNIFINMNGQGCIDIGIDNKYYIDRDLTKPYLYEQDDTVVDVLYEVYLLTKKD